MTAGVEQGERAAGPGPEAPDRAGSAVDAAADALREMILDGSLRPGARLREQDFSDRLSVARHTFRAATQILVGEGLLVRMPNRGVELTVLDEDDITDIFRLRTPLELEALRLLIESRAELGRVEAAVALLDTIPDDAPWRKVIDADMAFHRAIVEGGGSRRLERAYAGVESEIRVCMTQLRPHYESASEVAAEHTQLLTPMKAGDLDLAQELLKAHLDEAMWTLIVELATSAPSPA